MTRVFLYISKAFDKVCHKRIIYKLKQNGISGDLPSVSTSLPTCRKQLVILNGQYSSWANVEAGVPQGSIIGYLMILIYFNDMPENLSYILKIYAADSNDLNNDLNKIRH